MASGAGCQAQAGYSLSLVLRTSLGLRPSFLVIGASHVIGPSGPSLALRALLAAARRHSSSLGPSIFANATVDKGGPSYIVIGAAHLSPLSLAASRRHWGFGGGVIFPIDLM
jgi:hypothetical protein